MDWAGVFFNAGRPSAKAPDGAQREAPSEHPAAAPSSGDDMQSLRARLDAKSDAYKAELADLPAKTARSEAAE